MCDLCEHTLSGRGGRGLTPIDDGHFIRRIGFSADQAKREAKLNSVDFREASHLDEAEMNFLFWEMQKL